MDKDRDNVPRPSAGEGQASRSDAIERGRVLRSRAKSMRSAQTETEARLWHILRAKRFAGYKFRRQLIVDHTIADFACLQRRLIIEADGSQHADDERDRARDNYLRAQGFQVLRLWNNEIFENEEGVGDAILAALTAPLPAAAARRLSLPRSGGRDEDGASDA